MAKRFIDTDIFKKGFVKALQAPYKLLWIYILNDCNHAGIWEVELDVATLRLGIVLTAPPEDVFKDKIQVFDGGKKWFIPTFIEFQYGELNPQNRAHGSVIQILKSNNLIKTDEGAYKPLTTPLQGCKDKDMVKDKDKDKDKAREKFVYDLSFLDLPENDPYKTAFTDWLTYKGERRENYKSQKSLETGFNHLKKLSGYSPVVAAGIVEQAVSDQSQGMYPLKTNRNATNKKLNTGFEPSYTATNDDAKPTVHKYGG